MNNLRIYCITFFLIGTLIAHGQDTKTLNQVIHKGKADQVKALISIAGGQLFVKGGTEDLAKVDFSYDKNEWDPTVSYAEQDNLGKLSVNAKIEGDEKKIDEDNECHIQLNNNINYALGLVLGAGQADINLQNFNLQKALFRLGVGSFNVNLSNTSLPLLKVEAGIGEATFDLSGEYKNNLSAMINAGIGEIELIVPKDYGVMVSVSGFLGSVDTPGYEKNGKVYTNNLYGKTKYNLDIKIKGAIGTIDIIEK